MLLARAAAVTAVLAVTAAGAGPRVLASWPALALIVYVVALVGCLAHSRSRARARERTGGGPA